MALRFQAQMLRNLGVPLTKKGVFGVESWFVGKNGASLILEITMEITRRLALFVHLFIYTVNIYYAACVLHLALGEKGNTQILTSARSQN